MAKILKPPTHCPTCNKTLHWLAPTPPEQWLAVCFHCMVEYFGTASGQTGSRKRKGAHDARVSG